MIHSLMMLAVEANSVVALRMMKLMLGGTEARREAELEPVAIKADCIRNDGHSWRILQG